MPSLRGLDVAIVPSPNDEGLSELPHPDSSSIRLRGPYPASPTPSPASSLSTTPEKCKPTTSVYIPSSPGAQFHLRYSINRPPTDAKYLYFRMAMNGRQVVSWGIKSQAIQNQIVNHALYEPDHKWQYRESGVTYKREGVEKRYFHFTPRFGEISAAMDGGLIDLQVFRSKKRKRRAPQLADFRSQDKYGITSPTGGLVESPQDLTFYDWVLVDHVDSPFATFRFFYRTWAHLKALNLVPESYYEELMATSNMQCEHFPTTPQMQDRKVADREAIFFGFPLLDGSVFDDDGAAGGKMKGKKHEQCAQRAFYLATPPNLAPPPGTLTNMPQPSKLARDIRQTSDPMRPLPLLPDVEPSFCRSSIESTRAPSVTPSLLPYVDESSGADEFEFGVARRVILPSLSQETGEESIPARPLPTPPPMAPSPSSEYEMPPPSTGGLDVFRRVGRHEYMAAKGTSREQHIAESGNSAAVNHTPGVILTTENFSDMKTSEWKRLERSLSPLRRKQGRIDPYKRGARWLDETSTKSPLRQHTANFV